jgi:hypothetical protein
LGWYQGGSIACTLDARPFRTTGGFNLAERLPWLKPQSLQNKNGERQIKGTRQRI